METPSPLPLPSACHDLANLDPAIADHAPGGATALAPAVLEVRNLALRFGSHLVQEQVSFQVAARSIFAVIGMSGCGKSTLLRSLIGLLCPSAGQVLFAGVDYWAGTPAQRNQLRKGCGMLFQSAALWSSMTIAENINLPLRQLTALNPQQRQARIAEVLHWVGMDSCADVAPADLSGGMKKRAALARALAAAPPLLLLDEPSAGLDPINARRLDALILDIRDRTGAAVILVSHELPSLLAIANDGIFFDAESKRPIAHGSPRDMLAQSDNPTVHAFMRREILAASADHPAQVAATP